ncbi:glycosyltransferase [Erwinia sp. JUb26]|uniref:glycosyltransferase n=1 Tax=Erwinia sp. JUb26 TaxID=2485126 RepID=UPI000F460AEA|nr:glycosyltransferase [Erwinia sp. JUb26]ROR07724.1 glycosyltransferase involved in cell wall biosynthesis [Erwinia sp. JUb26]
MSSIMIAWVRYQRRADIMKEFWGYKDIYITSNFKGKVLKPFDYIYKIYQTILALRKEKPDYLWMQLPPTFMIFIGALYKMLSKKKVVLIGDFHNSAMRPKWFNIIGVKKFLNKLDVLIVHNEQVRSELLLKGISSHVIRVLEDMPFSYEKSVDIEVNGKSVLFPCSFDIDEPLDVVLNAAKLMPEVEVYITGKYEGKIEKSVVQGAPANVKFTGYLSKEKFDELFWSSGVILGLTTRDNVQLSVSNEALSAEKPMVLSDTTTLKNLFGEAAIFVDSLDSESISSGCVNALNDIANLENKTRILKESRTERWFNQAQRVREKMI